MSIIEKKNFQNKKIYQALTVDITQMIILSVFTGDDFRSTASFLRDVGVELAWCQIQATTSYYPRN